MGKRVQVGNVEVTIGVMDTPGQERFHQLALFHETGRRPHYSSRSRTKNHSRLSRDGRMRSGMSWGPSLRVVAVVGNRIDLGDARKVTTEQGESLARKIDALYFEVSAKSGEGCRELFVRVADVFLARSKPDLTEAPSIRHIAAYLLAGLGGDANPSIEKITAILNAAGVIPHPKAIESLIAKTAGKNVGDVVGEGTAKLSTVFGLSRTGDSGGGVGVGGNQGDSGEAQPTSASKSEPDQKKEEEAALDLAGGFDDLFG
jgi:large subunit ribosomal protein LP2